jgi:hypothetical protein
VRRHFTLPRAVKAMSLSLFWLVSSAYCFSQMHDVVCADGDGGFEAQFNTGITVRVGAARNGNFASRACAGTLSWDKQELSVAGEAFQLDVDGFDFDLAVGVPVVTFQVKKSSSDCCMEYRVYSLQKPPRLLRTISGGDFFSSSDSDLDGRVEIWTGDAAAVNQIDNLSLSELDRVPTVVLRFTGGKLLDVSSEFQPYFDQTIAKIKSGLRDEDLRDFQSSGGNPASFSSLPAERSHRLRATKAKVLEMVWANLYSGRAEEAWRLLNEMWPSGDVGRIRAELLNARARGIRSQIDGESKESSSGRKKHAQIFDAVSREQAGGKLEIIPPTEILLRRPPDSMAQAPDQAEDVLDLVIDSAGKVRSVELAERQNLLIPN